MNVATTTPKKSSIAAHPEAEKPKEQHHYARHGNTVLLLALHLFLFK
jgi:hypothetical protein